MTSCPKARWRRRPPEACHASEQCRSDTSPEGEVGEQSEPGGVGCNNLGRGSNPTRPPRLLPPYALALAWMLAVGLPANAQEAMSVGALAGTLKKIKETGTITLGYRESSLPFSYLNRRQQPIGYSMDLCREIVEDVSTELDGMDVRIIFAPVTPANRLQKVASGEVDLECGSTTANVQRRKEVAFSPIFFVAGTKLMVPKASPVKSVPRPRRQDGGRDCRHHQ